MANQGLQMDDDGVFNMLHGLRLCGAAHVHLREGRTICMEGPIVIWLDNDLHLKGESLGIHLGLATRSGSRSYDVSQGRQV